MTLMIREPRLGESNLLARSAYAAWLKGVAPCLSQANREGICELDFADFIRESPGKILAGYLDGRAAGFVATENGDNYISDLWVDPKVEGRGIGTALLQAMEEAVRARGYDTLTIEVLTANTRALGLYRRLGYVTVWQGLHPEGRLEELIHKTKLTKALA